MTKINGTHSSSGLNHVSNQAKTARGIKKLNSIFIADTQKNSEKTSNRDTDFLTNLNLDIGSSLPVDTAYVNKVVYIPGATEVVKKPPHNSLEDK